MSPPVAHSGSPRRRGGPAGLPGAGVSGAGVAAWGRAALVAAILALGPPLAGVAAAQPASGPPNALQGFSQNRDKPVKIESASLEVRDKEKMATFAGDVHLVQGDVTLKCQSLVVFYEPDAKSSDPKPGAKPAAAAPATAGPAGSQQIKRIEARGSVVVTQKDQIAAGDAGIFDMKANTVTLLGNVVISQGPNAVKGDRLVVDIGTGVSRVECGKTNGSCRVSAVLQPGSQSRPDAPGATPAPPGGSREAPRPRPAGPSGLY
ncbi:MAG: LPS ABC transporter substrate-binding protein LptA [Rhodovulum sp.]|nr:LPS ABC transporter substrate-binding protein LptA [Rhodovulum sp.]